MFLVFLLSAPAPIQQRVNLAAALRGTISQPLLPPVALFICLLVVQPLSVSLSLSLSGTRREFMNWRSGRTDGERVPIHNNARVEKATGSQAPRERSGPSACFFHAKVGARGSLQPKRRGGHECPHRRADV